MLKELLKNTHQYINYFFEHIDVSEFEDVFNTIKNCQGMIVLTGVGKSGLVAKKIAATMTSTNTRAIYLSPVNAMHGDLGVVTERDVFIFLSKSGESDELLTLIPSLKNKGVKMIAVVSNKNSRLAKACNKTLHLPLEKELCPFNMAPTTSTTIQMIFGDVISVALMQLNRFSLDDYALNHPAGSIGKRITVKVRDLMIVGDSIPKCHQDDRLVDQLVELSNKRCGCILIVDNQHHLQGIFTDGDLRRALQKNGPEALHLSMKNLMCTNPRTITPNILATEAVKVMENGLKNEVTALPVINDEMQVVGVIKLHDIVQSGIS